MTITKLQRSFAEAVASEDMEQLSQVLVEFDQFCRNQVEAETDLVNKKKLIEDLMEVEQSWQKEILQLKAKVRGKIADIKSNGKKINKYLTSF